MIADNVRASVRLSRKDIDKILESIPPDHEFTVYEAADCEMAYFCDKIMNSGVHFDLGDMRDLSDNIPDLDTLVRQLSILGARLPYRRMSISVYIDMEVLIEREAPQLARKTGIDQERIKAILNPNGHAKTHFCLMLDSLSDDLVLGSLWFTHSDPEELLLWGGHPYSSLISLYTPFNERDLPDPEFFDEKGLSFLNAYRDEICKADSCICSIPVNSPEVRRLGFDKGLSPERVDFLDKKTEENEKNGHSIVQMELFRFLFLLNTKGVGVENIAPNIKANKRRQRDNTYPLLDYKVLKVEAMTIGHRKNMNCSGDGGWHNRIHTCRGHIKIYTIEKPLLGHTVGPVWIRPHLRGKRPEVLVKDYQVIGDRDA